MNKINMAVRFKNPIFIVQIVVAVFLPILSYMGLTVQDLTTWKVVGDALMEAVTHPYVLGLVIVSVLNAVNDPTTKGLTDSEAALEYKTPK